MPPRKLFRGGMMRFSYPVPHARETTKYIKGDFLS